MSYEAIVSVTREYRFTFEDSEVRPEETPEETAYDIAYNLDTWDSTIVHTEVEVMHSEDAEV